MRRFVGALLCAACALLVIPGSAVTEPRDRFDTVAALAIQRESLPPLSDELTIMLVGTGLIGLAALIRRTKP